MTPSFCGKEAPIPFEREIRVTMEHGHADHRSDNFYAVAYRYRIESHAPVSSLPKVKDRIPRLYPTGGAGRPISK